MINIQKGSSYEESEESGQSIDGEDFSSFASKHEDSSVTPAQKDDNRKKNKARQKRNFNLGNYTSEDMASLSMITQEMNRRMEMARGMKRGRKVQGFADYCQKTTDRINDLKN